MIIILMLSTIVLVPGAMVNKKKNNVQAANKLTSADYEIVNEISNMTGISSDEIEKLKTTNNSWNDVLNMLKDKSKKSQNDNIQKRSDNLSEADIDTDFIASLKKEGFNNTQIIVAKDLVERVISELQQISDSGLGVPSNLSNGTNNGEADNQNLEPYNDLAKKINLKTAVYLLLKLEKDFGSIEAVLDEYLLSLQIGVDLKMYLTDTKLYEKEKDEQSSKFDMSKIINIASIEAKLIGILQNENTKKNNMEQNTMNNQNITNNKQNSVDNNTPVSPLPDIKNPKPENPQKDLLNEINELKNKSLN